MTTQEIIDELVSLVKLDDDAIVSYNEAIKETDVEAISSQLMQFRDDHERHVSDLSATIRAMGHQPPERTPNSKEYFIEAFSAVRSLIGTEGALETLRENEKIANQRYSDAAAMDLPPEILRQVQANYDDECRHLEYMEQAINGRIWEPSETRMR